MGSSGGWKKEGLLEVRAQSNAAACREPLDRFETRVPRAQDASVVVAHVNVDMGALVHMRIDGGDAEICRRVGRGNQSAGDVGLDQAGRNRPSIPGRG